MDTIYLDNAATTQPLPMIQQMLEEYIQTEWYNPSARYVPATRAAQKMDEARKQIADLFGYGYQVLFTASGTEADNTVIFRGAQKRKSMHFVTDRAEHPAVYEAMNKLAASGYDVTFVPTDSRGQVDPQTVADAVREDTVLVSIMHVNNETGAVNDIAAMAQMVKAKNRATLFHADGVQAYGRVFADDTQNIDYYTVSAHKIHALKGVGAVLYKKGLPLKPYIYGGGQEGGLRSGTENTFGIFCFAQAAAYFREHQDEIAANIRRTKEAFLQEISHRSDIHVITPKNGAPHLLCLRIDDVRGEVLLHALEAEGIYISTGSACSSKKGVSRTAKSLGFSQKEAEGIVRISFSCLNTPQQGSVAAKKMLEKIDQLNIFIRK